MVANKNLQCFSYQRSTAVLFAQNLCEAPFLLGCLLVCAGFHKTSCDIRPTYQPFIEKNRRDEIGGLKGYIFTGLRDGLVHPETSELNLENALIFSSALVYSGDFKKLFSNIRQADKVSKSDESSHAWLYFPLSQIEKWLDDIL